MTSHLYRSLATAVLLAGAGVAHGQANCALRHPDRQIYDIFKEATAYRTFEAPVDHRVRPIIEKELGSPLAQTDSGIHTAYLVLNKNVPIGIVHARTENGTRGSVELVWALDLDLSIRDLRVQRSRERHTRVIESESFRDRLVGRDLRSLRELLSRGNDQVNVAALGVDPDASSIARTVVLCGLKTRIITEVAFRDALTPARLLGQTHAAFPATTSVTRVSKPFNEQVAAATSERLGGDVREIDIGSLVILRARGADETSLGTMVYARWGAHPEHPETWWAISPDGAIRSASVVGDLEPSVHEAFNALRGRDLDRLTAPAADDAPSRCGREVLAILASHGDGS